jgi:diacylglycerol O-acyltransferase / wax synthase
MEGVEQMSRVDRAWLLMERPRNPMMVVGLIVLDGSVGYRRLRNLVSERLLAFDRFRCRPVSDTLGARWVRQAEFDLSDHVSRVTLPGGAGQHELESLVGQLASTQLSTQWPLWSFHLVENYHYGSAIIVRIHHCYADGIALIRVLLSLADTEAKHRPPHASAPPPRLFAGRISKTISETTDLLKKGMHYALRPVEAFGLGGELAQIAMLPDDPPTCLKKTLTGVRRVAWSAPASLDEVRTIGRVLGCTINDVLVATLAGALGRYLESRGDAVAGVTIRAAVPVNLRPDDDSQLVLGNNFGLFILELPVGIRHPLSRLYSVQRTMQKLKGSPQALVTLGLLAVIGSLPAAVEGPVMAIFSAKASLVASNVPGPQQQLHLAGVPVSQALFWVPQAGSIGMGVSMLTYNGAVQFGVMSDRALIPEPGDLTRIMQDELKRLILFVLPGGGTSAA